MTGNDYVYNLMLLNEVQEASLTLDTGTCLMLINRARNQVFNDFAEDYPWMFGDIKTSTTTNPAVFIASDKFVEEVVVAYDDGSGKPKPARKTDYRELNTVVNHSFNMPTVNDPCYTRKVRTVSVYTTASETPTAGITVIVWYLRAPTDLALTDTDNEIPYFLQELVLRRGYVNALEKLGMTDSLAAVQNDLKDMSEMYEERFEQTEQNARVALESKRSLNR